MWPSWLSRRARRSTPCPSTALVAATTTPSLRDIQSMVHQEPAANPPQSGAPSPRIFHRFRVAVTAILLLRALQPAQVAAGDETQVAAGEEAQIAAWEGDGRLVLYFTSLHAIRRTFRDCCAVRTILRVLNAVVDERDLIKDPSFASELAALLPRRPGVTLPQLFIGSRHIGGVEEVRRLYASGELRCIVEASSALPSCDRCGGERFVPCGSCDGSHRRFIYNSSGVGGRFRACADCNTNGLVRCPDCFYSPAA